MVECKICLLHFDSQNLRPMVGSCGHTVCHACMLQIGAYCSVCRKKSFKNPTVNFILLELIEVEKNKPTTGVEEKLAALEEKFEKRLKENCDKMMSFMSGKVEKIEEKMDLMAIDNFRVNRANKTKIEKVKEKLHGKMDLICDSLSEIKKYVEADKIASVDLANEAFISDETRIEAIAENLAVDRADSGPLSQKKSLVTASFERLLSILKPSVSFPDLPTTAPNAISTPPETVRHPDRHSTTGRRAVHRCRHCYSVLPENLQLREDGVSVNCKCCDKENIIAPAQTRWMKSLCKKGDHFHQWPLAQSCYQPGECPVCRDLKNFYNCNYSEARVVYESPTIQK